MTDDKLDDAFKSPVGEALAALSPSEQSTVLATLFAIWLSQHPASRREDLLAEHVRTVRTMASVYQSLVIDGRKRRNVRLVTPEKEQ